MEIINYNIVINAIKEAKKNFYDCNFVSVFFTDILVDDEIEIEDEELFNSIFSGLQFYMCSFACDDRGKFIQIIDDLIEIIDRKKLTAFHIDFILNKNDVLKIINKYHENKINLKVLIQQLYKYFNNKKFEEVKLLLLNEFQIEIFCPPR